MSFASGHTTIHSLHYRELLGLFGGHIPALILTGPRHTGKHFAANVSAAYLGTKTTSGDDICIVKESTLAGIKQRISDDAFPVTIHDFKEDKTIVTLLNECYEGKPTLNFNQQFVPSTSLTITCNEAQMMFLRRRYEIEKIIH